MVIISYGIWAYKIKKEKIPNKLIDCFSLPIDTSQLIDEIKNAKKIITVEDGVEAGGLGSLVLEIINDANLSIPVKRLALRFDGGYPTRFTDREDIF